MKVDRYTKFVLTIIAVGLWALVIKGVIAPQPAIAGIGLAAAPTEEALLQSETRIISRILFCIDSGRVSGSVYSGSFNGRYRTYCDS